MKPEEFKKILSNIIDRQVKSLERAGLTTDFPLYDWASSMATWLEFVCEEDFESHAEAPNTARSIRGKNEINSNELNNHTGIC